MTTPKPVPQAFEGVSPTGYRYLTTRADVDQVWERDFFIPTAADKDYRIVVNASLAATITSITTRCASGTCTLTGKINTTALGGTANSVSSSEETQTHSSANSVAVGDDVVLTISSNSSALDVSVHIAGTVRLA